MTGAALLASEAGSPSPANRTSELSPSHPAAFVWGFWGVLLFLALRHLYRFGSGTPLHEDWFSVGFLTGSLKPTLSTFWSQGSSDHRAPLATLLIFLDLKLFGVNFLPILYLSVFCCAALAAGLIWAARRVRGRTVYADAFFPVLLLHLGHAEIFLWEGPIIYVMTTFFAGSFLIIQVASRWRPGPIAALVSGVFVALLPLCYGGGVAVTPFLALSLAYSGYRLLQARQRASGSLCMFFALLAFLLIGAYLSGYKLQTVDPGGEGVPPARTLRTVVDSTFRFLCVGFGPAIRPPAYTLVRRVFVGLLLVGFGCLASSLLRRSSATRDCAVGLSLYLMACLTIALAAGYSRSTYEYSYLFDSRYAIASVPTLLCLYFVWEFCGPEKGRGIGRIVLFNLAFSPLFYNWVIGLEQSPAWSEPQRAFDRDLRAGLPIPELVSNHWFTLCFSADRFESGLRSLRDARIGEYRNLPPDPPVHEVRLPLVPAAVHNLEWKGTKGRGIGPEPSLTFALKEPTYVSEARIKYSCKSSTGANPQFHVTWRDSTQNEDFIDVAGRRRRRFRYCWPVPSDHEIEIRVWICGSLDQIRIYPDMHPCDFTISEIVLLLPDSESTAKTSPAAEATDPALPSGRQRALDLR